MTSGLNTELDPPTIYNVDSNQSNLNKNKKSRAINREINSRQ